MTKVENAIKISDEVCNILPGVSSFTNASQLIYKLAHKVDTAANPVAHGVRDDVKIYTLNKSKMDCVLCMIPIIGNIWGLARLIVDRLTSPSSNQLLKAIEHNDVEVVKLYLANHKVKDSRVAGFIWQARPEIVNLILNSRPWSFETLMNIMDRSKEDANLILDNFDAFVDHQPVKEEGINKAIECLENFIKAGNQEIVSKMITVLPDLDFKQVQRLLLDYSYPSYPTPGKKENVLTEENIEELLKHCKQWNEPCLALHCQKVHNYGKALNLNVARNTALIMGRKNPIENPEQIIDKFYEIHGKILQKLLDLMKDNDATGLTQLDIGEGYGGKVVGFLSQLIRSGDKVFVDLAMNKFGDKLTTSNKLSLLEKNLRHLNMSEDPEKTLAIIKDLFVKFNKEFSDGELNKLFEASEELIPKELIQEIKNARKKM